MLTGYFIIKLFKPKKFLSQLPMLAKLILLENIFSET